MKLTILIDTREKNPLVFSGYDTRKCKLKHGDYSARGLKGLVEIERKSTADLLHSITIGWEGFRRKLARFIKTKTPIIIVEGNIHDVLYSIYCTDKMRRIFLSRLAAMMMTRIPVFFSGSREISEDMIVKILTKASVRG